MSKNNNTQCKISYTALGIAVGLVFDGIVGWLSTTRLSSSVAA